MQATTNLRQLLAHVEALPVSIQRDIFAYVDFLRKRSQDEQQNLENAEDIFADILDDLPSHQQLSVDNSVECLEINIDYDLTNKDDIFAESLHSIDPEVAKKAEREQRKRERFRAFRAKQAQDLTQDNIVEVFDENWKPLIQQQTGAKYSKAQMRHRFNRWYQVYEDCLTKLDKHWAAERLGRSLLSSEERKKVFEQLFAEHSEKWDAASIAHRVNGTALGQLADQPEGTDKQVTLPPEIFDDVTGKFKQWRQIQQQNLDENYRRWQNNQPSQQQANTIDKELTNPSTHSLNHQITNDATGSKEVAYTAQPVTDLAETKGRDLSRFSNKNRRAHLAGANLEKNSNSNINNNNSNNLSRDNITSSADTELTNNYTSNDSSNELTVDNLFKNNDLKRFNNISRLQSDVQNNNEHQQQLQSLQDELQQINNNEECNKKITAKIKAKKRFMAWKQKQQL